MRLWFPLGIVLLLAAGVGFAGTSLDAPIRITPELEPFVVEGLGGKLFVAIDDMLLPIDLGRKSALLGTTWTDGVVYYQFDESVDAEDDRPLSGDGAARRAAWQAAAMEWQATVPGLVFVEGTGSGNYILVYSSGGNSSAVGMAGGAQTMNIFNWNYRFIISHEIGHALGLMHEQSRNDRATFITVNFENIQDAMEYNYSIFAGTTDHGVYDYGSVMHYGRCSFADDGYYCEPNYTMNSTAAGAATVGLTQAEANSAMGQRGDLSAGDIAGVRSLYPGANGLVFDSCFENGRTNAWSSVAGESPSCAHDVCESGAALEFACSQCATDVCTYDPYCCNNAWDSMCVSYVPAICGTSCY